MNRYPKILAILLAVLSVAGGVSAYRLTERIEFGLPAGHGVRLSLRNVHGAITVTSWDRAEVGVTAMVKIRAASRDKAREIFDGIALDFLEDEGWISIGAALPAIRKDTLSGEGNTTVWIDYDIKVPASAGLEISCVTGSIEVSGVEGPFDLVSESGSISMESSGGDGVLKTGSGDITCVMGALTDGGTLVLRTGNGDIRLDLPGDTGALIAARSRNGKLKTRLEIDGVEKSGPGEIKGVLGNGDGRIVVESANGDVTIGKL